jgi:Uma2 family endonuclease
MELRALEESTGVRHELIHGVAYAMSGGSPRHARLKTNLLLALGTRLKGSTCRLADSDQKVRVPATGAGFYADLTVICGPYAYDVDDDYAIVNPTVLFEVLSPTTQDHDRGTKFQHYRRLDSLQEYVLVSQDEVRVEVRRRVEGGWFVFEVTEGEVELASLAVSLPLDELFDFAGLGEAVSDASRR